MLTDAHCHPFALKKVFAQAEDQRRALSVLCAASASNLEEFAYIEELARKAALDKAAGVFPCFAIHPQLPLHAKTAEAKSAMKDGLLALENLAASGRLAAVGETGFDLYNAGFKETERAQDELFAAHLDAALRHGLPLVIHSRRAIHKIFAAAKTLAKCKAVIFHSWPGAASEGEAVLKRGVNAYFSFGNPVTLNHHKAMRCVALFPEGRLLFETDAPFQPQKDSGFSSWADLRRIIETAASLRGEAGSACAAPLDLENRVRANFKEIFMDFAAF